MVFAPPASLSVVADDDAFVFFFFCRNELVRRRKLFSFSEKREKRRATRRPEGEKKRDDDDDDAADIDCCAKVIDFVKGVVGMSSLRVNARGIKLRKRDARAREGTREREKHTK